MIQDAPPVITPGRSRRVEAADSGGRGTTVTRGVGPRRERNRSRSWRLGAEPTASFVGRSSPDSGRFSLPTVVHEFTAAWERGESPLVEDYLRRLDPADFQGAVDLIYREYCLAEADGRAPDADSYVARFPRYGEELRRLFHFHGACSPSLLGRLLGPAPASGRGDAGLRGTRAGPAGGGRLDRALPAPPRARARELRPRVPRRAGGPGQPPGRGQDRDPVDPRALAAGPGAARPHRRDPLALHGRRRRVPVDLHAVLGRRDPGRRAGRAIEGDPTEWAGLGIALAVGDGARRPQARAARPAARGNAARRPAPTCWRPSTPSRRPSIRRSTRPGPREILAPLSYDRAIAWVIARLAEALDHASSRDVTHGDVKPSNILLSADGNPMLLDFNLARDERAGRGSVGSADRPRRDAGLHGPRAVAGPGAGVWGSRPRRRGRQSRATRFTWL